MLRPFVHANGFAPSMRFFCLPLLLVVIVTPLEAQRLSHVSIEGTLGVARALTGIPFTSHGSLAMDAILAVRLKGAPGHSVTGGASVSRFYKGGCDASCQPLPDGSCAPCLPNFSSRGLLVGWEALSRAGESVRLMVGPVWLQRIYADTTTSGVQGRLDLGAHMTGRLGAVLSARWSHLLSFRGRAMNLHAFGFGFRLK